MIGSQVFWPENFYYNYAEGTCWTRVHSVHAQECSISSSLARCMGDLWHERMMRSWHKKASFLSMTGTTEKLLISVWASKQQPPWQRRGILMCSMQDNAKLLGIHTAWANSPWTSSTLYNKPNLAEYTSPQVPYREQSIWIKKPFFSHERRG